MAPPLARLLGQRLGPAGAESVGGVDDRPLLLAQPVDAVLGDHPGREAVVGAEAEQPGIAELRQNRVGAAETDRFPRLQDVGRHGVVLGRADRTEEADEVALRRQFREGEDRAGIGGLVVLGDDLQGLAEHPAGFVDRLQSDLGPGERVAAGIRAWPRHREHHADPDCRPGALSTGRADHPRRQTARDCGCGTRQENAARRPHWRIRPTADAQARRWRRWSLFRAPMSILQAFAGQIR